MAKSTKLEYREYKALQTALDPTGYREVREDTVDGMAYRKTIIVILGEREFRFVGPWKHEYHEVGGAGGVMNTPTGGLID